MSLNFYTIIALNVIALLYLFTNAVAEFQFEPDDLKKKTNNYTYNSTPCNIFDDNIVCGSDLNFYPNTCIATQNNITRYKPKILCENELANKYCRTKEKN